MTDLDDLRVQLERLGRQPVPLPRQEFADKLLRDLQSGETTGVLPMPTPLHSRERRRSVPGRIAALGSIAAVLLLVVGLVSVATGGGSKQQVTFNLEPTSSPSEKPVGGVKLNDDGQILKDVKDGWVLATCEKAGQFKIVGGDTYTCKQGETMRLLVEGQRIAKVEPYNGTLTEVATVSTEVPATPPPQAPATTAPANSSAAVPSTASTVPASTTVVTSPTTGEPTTTTSRPTPTGVGTAPAKVDMKFEAQRGDKQVSFTWSPFTGAGFAKYVMVRSTGLAAITYPATGDGAEIWSSDEVDTVGYIEADLPIDADVARYQLFVVDEAGNVLAASDVVKVELSLGTSTSSTTAPVPTVTTPTAVTTTSAGGDAKG